MLSYEQSLAIANEYLTTQIVPECGDVLICDSQDCPAGWVFFYQTRAYLESGQSDYALAGNAPILVSRESGKITVTGTAKPLEHYLSAYDVPNS